MFIPADFVAADANALIQRLAKRWSGVLITIGEDGAPIATHIPVRWDEAKQTIIGHIARANPQWKQGSSKALVVLNGPEAYITPNWYPSKTQHGKTVPTWNYEAVHITGQLEWFEDRPRLEAVLRDVSDYFESDQPKPWAFDDAPRSYTDALLRGIVGFTLKAERVEAKRKLSQNKDEADYAGVVAGLSASADPMAQEVAELMRAERGED